MDFLALQDLTVSYLDDLNYGYFTQTQVKVWVNQAKNEVQKRLIKAGANYYTKAVTTPTVINQRYYTLPADFRKINRLEIVTSGTIPNESSVQIQPITINQIDLTVGGVGQPQYYYIDKDCIVLQPAPDVAQTLRLMYTYSAADMTASTDVPDVPSQYHQLIALLATEDGFLKDGRTPEFIAKKIKEYDEMLYADSTDRQQDTVRMIVSTGSDSAGSLYW